MKLILRLLVVFSLTGFLYSASFAEDLTSQDQAVVEQPQEVKILEPATDTQKTSPQLSLAESMPNAKYFDPVKYTLGPDDTVEISVMRHPEFSGEFPVNQEGKIQYKFVGDIDVTGLTKAELEKKIRDAISTYVISPEVSVTIMEYKSKVIYVLGEVGIPGRYYMKSESIPVREAVVEAGLPTLAAAMRRCRLITPDKSGKAKIKSVDLYAILYGGNLKNNLDMHPGDVLYVPATMMAKFMRIFSPVTAPITNLNTGKNSATDLATKTAR